MRKRALSLSVLASVAVLLSACSSVEGQRAQELLLQAQTAEAQLRSSSFEGSMSYSLAGQGVRVAFEGGGSDEGQYFAMRSAGGLGEAFDVRFIIRGKSAWLRLNGSWQQMPVPTELGSAVGSGSLGSAAFQELAKHVKKIRVNEHQLVGGEPSAIIGGELDTAGLIQSFGKLSALAGETDSFDLDALGVKVGDISATLTISERTHLLTSALVTLRLEAAGEKLDLQLTYRLTAVNQAVRIPAPGPAAS